MVTTRPAQDDCKAHGPFRVRSSLPVARPTADLSQPCAPPVGLSLATRSPGVVSQPCGAKHPRFCADSKGV